MITPQAGCHVNHILDVTNDRSDKCYSKYRQLPMHCRLQRGRACSWEFNDYPNSAELQTRSQTFAFQLQTFSALVFTILHKTNLT